MKPRASLDSLFLEQGTEVIVPEHHRLIAEDEASLWLLAEGEADLFFIDLQSGEKIELEHATTPFVPEKLNGFLTFIKHAVSGDFLFPFGFDNSSNLHILIRASRKCRLLKLSKRLFEQAASDSLKSELKTKSEEWILNFSNLYPYFEPPPETNQRPERVDQFLNLDIENVSTIWRELTHLHDSILNAHRAKRSFETLLIKDQTDASRKMSQQSLKHAFDDLQSILELKEDYISREIRPHRLFMACQIVASYLRIPFNPSRTNFNAETSTEYMVKICEDADVNHREIKLKKGWWNHNFGPFIGFYGPNETPVALLPVGINAYQMIDVETNAVQPVDEKLDEELSVFGYVFYRPFPDKPVLGLKDIINVALEDKGRVFAKIFNYGLIAALLSLFLPFGTKILFNYIIPFSDTNILIQLFLGLIVMLVTSNLFIFSREWLMVYRDGKILHDLMMAFWLRLFSLPVKFFSRFEVGALIQRAFVIESIHKAIAGPNLRVILNSFFSLLYLIPMFYFSPLLTVVAIILLIPFVVFSVINIIRNYRGNLTINELQQEANAHVLQFLMGIFKIRNAGAENLSFVLWEKIFSQIKRRQWQLQKLLNWSLLFNYTISQMSYLFFYAILLLALTSLKYSINLADFLAFTSALGFFLPAVLDLCNTVLEVSNAGAQWKLGKVLLEEPPEVDASKVKPPILNGDIVVDRLKFRYDSDGPLLFNDISFHAKPGEFIALVGSSGCGKSTLVRLLTGFETPEGGAIYYEGKDLSTLNLRLLRKQLGIVLQTTKVLDGSLRTNVTGGETYTDEEIIAALNLSGFGEDLKHLPMGMATVISNDGASFSGGQIQRIIIARALIGKPKILILDEATAALDNKTQEIIKRNLLSLKVTRIIIAHRLSTIMEADRIYALDKGKIVEEGSFTELMNKKGFFYNLVNKQHTQN